jgi:ketosteroid isomerase-like protein
MHRPRLVLATFVIAGLTGCQKPADQLTPAPDATLTEAEAIRIATAPMADWDKKGTQALDTAYAPDAIGYEPTNVALVTGSAGFIQVNKDLLKMRFDKVNVREQKVQILSNQIFIFTTSSDMRSTTGPIKSMTWRCTDVFQRKGTGPFRTVNEHCSYPPKP